MSSILQRHNVTVTGQGRRPLMFAHGFGCDQNMWRFVAPAFTADYQVVTFDYLGAGKSDKTAYNPLRYSTLDAYAEDVRAICAALDLHDVVFVGHSVSSTIGMLAALQEPERFDSLVLIGPSPCYLNDGDYQGGFTREDIEDLLMQLDSNYLGWSSMMAPAIVGNPDRPDLAAEWENSFCQTDPAIARQFARLTFLADNRADLPRLRTPALILQCADDLIAPRTVGEYVHQALPQSELIYLQATGHCPHLSHPEETIAHLRRYLNARRAA